MKSPVAPGRFLLLPVLALGLGLVIGPAMAEDFPEPASLSSARVQLSTLHLLRGLQLEPGQLDMLETLAEAARHHRQSFLATERARWSEWEKDIRQYMDELLEGKARDGRGYPLGNQVYLASGENRARANVWLGKLQELENTARRILSPGQLRLVEGFTSCVVAPEYMADPERIGQAGKASVYLDQIKEVRKLDANTWEQDRDSWIEAFLAGVEGEVGPLAPPRRRLLGERARNSFELARSLDPLTFRIRQQELAEFLNLELEEQLHRQEDWENDRKLAGGPGAVARWLLSEEALPLYPRLADALARGVILPDPPEIFAARCAAVPGQAKNCATGSLYTVKSPEGDRP